MATQTATPKTTPTNKGLTSGQTTIIALDDACVPYAPIATTKAGKPVLTSFVGGVKDANGMYIEWWPKGFDPNKHTLLNKCNFASTLLFDVYKGCVQHPWYVRGQMKRIRFWHDDAYRLMHPDVSKTTPQTPAEINAAEMKRLGMDAKTYAAHVQQQMVSNA